jgi:glyoxylase-like metal-dependent hydrolase (beta-lactamase superfamily II)
MKLRASDQFSSIRQTNHVAVGYDGGLSIVTDRNWTPWLPTYAWVIEHPEGVIIVDTGQGTHLLEAS